MLSKLARDRGGPAFTVTGDRPRRQALSEYGSIGIRRNFLQMSFDFLAPPALLTDRLAVAEPLAVLEICNLSFRVSNSLLETDE